ncbi:MAG: hypothetical protein M1832_002733 [Thelocarpon impressellum]|nr:MAG: hypothetical protein M1832_002733 [Thelocarpon impressellum]
MARRSSRPQRTSASTPTRKRAASATTAIPVRQAKRVKSNEGTPASKRSTPRTSRHFEQDDSPEEESEADSEIENELSGYEDDEGSAVSSPPESAVSEDDDEEYESEDHPKPKAQSRQRQGQKEKKKEKEEEKGQEVWRSGVKTGLGPGKQVVIKIPKARAAGATPYEPHTLHPNTMLFLGDLAKNNDREWLQLHNADFRASEKDFDSFAGALTEKIVEHDETIPELPVKDIVGQFSDSAGPAPLALMRRAIDRRADKLKQVLCETRLRKEFLGVTAKDEKKLVAAFIGQNQENILKTKPKGFEYENPNIELLRLRSYTIGKRIADEAVMGPGGLSRVADLLGVLTPFITYLNSVVMPDDASSDEDSEGGDEEDGEESD